MLLAPPPLPSALEAEHALLGMALYDNAVMKRVRDLVSAGCFHEPYHARLWEMAEALVEKGRLADATAIGDRLKEDPAFQDYGGLRFLADLIESAPPLNTAVEFAQRVADAARRREIIRIADEATHAARDPSCEPFTVITETDAAMTALMVAAAPDGHTLIGAREAAIEAVNEMDHEAETGYSPGLRVGLDCIDQNLLGLFPNELLILAGRPSMGKSGLARAIAFAGARKNPDRLFPIFALEMDKRQLSRRTLSQLSYEAGRGIPYKAMKQGGKLAGEQRALLADVARRVPSNFLIDETATLSIEHVERRLLSLSKRGKIGLVVIDYLQIMDLTALLSRGMNLTTALGMVTSRLKRLAKQLECTILLLSQLSRKCEDRDNKRPQLSDLRDSGSIEQDASVVMFAYRDSYYLEREGPRRGVSREEHELAVAASHKVMEVIFGKSREGAVSTTRQIYLAEFDVIENMGMYG